MPWRGKKDVERHNKKCAQYPECVKLWLKKANDYYTNTGDDGQAVIRANVSAKKWLQSHGHYRRNMSDEELRQLERRAAIGSFEDLIAYIRALIRAGAQIPSTDAGRELWINAYVNNQAMASCLVPDYESALQVATVLYNYFRSPPLVHSSHEVYDVQLQQTVTVPAFPVTIKMELTPAFNFDTGMALPRPQTIEPYVSFRLIENLEPDILEDTTEPFETPIEEMHVTWLNVYIVTRHFGSPAEGGSYYNAFEPLATTYITSIPRTIARNNPPEHLQIIENLYDALE